VEFRSAIAMHLWMPVVIRPVPVLVTPVPAAHGRAIWLGVYPGVLLSWLFRAEKTAQSRKPSTPAGGAI
jgi:hypothetical protein